MKLQNLGLLKLLNSNRKMIVKPLKLNLSRLDEYKNVFGTQKICSLWNEFIAQSKKNWQTVDNADWEGKRLIFHSWRSSSQVFGMDDFSAICLVIEDRIIRHRLNGLDKLIVKSQDIFEESVKQAALIFSKMEPQND